MWCERAPAASALTTFPWSDWSSNRPSPVMTRSAAATSLLRPVCSAMIAAPDSGGQEHMKLLSSLARLRAAIQQSASRLPTQDAYIARYCASVEAG